MRTVKKLISLNESTAKELEFLSKVTKTTQREIIENALDFYFDYTDGIVADEITKKVKSGEMAIYDAQEVYKELGIELED